jgi:HSP20 family protein
MELIVRRPQRATREFGSLGRAMNRFFDDSFFTARGSRGVSYATLPVDISERDGDLVVRASVPGFAKDEIEVRVNDGVLSISASHSEQIEDGDGAESDEHYYRRERRSGTLSRRITLPSKVRDSEVDAELADGVLTLTIPTPEEEKPKQIEIRTSK